MFKKMPFLLVAMLVAIYIGEPFFPLIFKEVLYAISLSTKSAIITLLPCIIFALLFKTVVRLSSHASKIIGLVLIAVCASNLMSTLVSQQVGQYVYGFNITLDAPHELQALHPLWIFEFPKIIPNNFALMGGIALGLLLSWRLPHWAKRGANACEALVNKILQGVLWALPLFIIGFVLKLKHDGIMAMIVEKYAFIFIIIACAQFSYIGFIYFVANQFRLAEALQSIKNMLPAGIAGFTTMSSAAAMPLTLIGVSKNGRNPTLSQSVIPLTVNIHLIGDCFAIPILAYAILKGFNLPEPSVVQYFIFALYFILAKFSVAAIPGGGIIVMLPILEAYLGFSGEMMSLITALYILFDPVITCANVLGNGAFAFVISKCVRAQTAEYNPSTS